MKKIFLTILFFTFALYSRNLYILSDNNKSTDFKIEQFIFKKSINKEILNSLNIEKIYLLRDGKKSKEYKNGKKPTIKDLYKYTSNKGLIKTLKRVIANSNYTQGDIIVLISSLDYINKVANINASGKKYNDGWLTSNKSPIKNLLNEYSNKPLNGINIFILDPNTNLLYLKNRTRFFYHLFNKLGAKLIFYGSLDKDKLRFYDYAKNNNIDLIKAYKNQSLNNEKILKLDESIVQYELN